MPYAPAVERNLAAGFMTVADLARAAQVESDNVAANLLIGLLGGTQGLRAWGDAVSRLDRLEPALNLVPEGELRDTTTPAAMARLVATIVTGDVLAEASRALLVGWMRETRTGLKRIRAGFPADWLAGDKTGTAEAPGMGAKINDVAVVWPPGRNPLVVAAYYDLVDPGRERTDADQAVLAAVGRIAAGSVA